MEMSRLTQDGTAAPVSRYQILRHKRGQGDIRFPCSADHVQDWQLYPVDQYPYYMCDHSLHTYILFGLATNALNVRNNNNNNNYYCLKKI